MDLTKEQSEKIAAMAGRKDVSAKEIASVIGVDPKRFRDFMRSAYRRVGREDALPGSGGAYAFNGDEVQSIIEAFASYKTRGKRTFVVLSDLFDNETDE